MPALSQRFVNAAKALMGFSSYAGKQPTFGPDEQTQRTVRENFGGQLQLLPTTQTRWYLEDLEIAQRLADTGKLNLVGQLWRAMKRDGYIQGLTETRTAGLVALEKRYRGRQDMIDALKSANGSRSIFDEMFPPSELALLAGDGLGVGIGVGELVPVEGRDFPVLVRYDPEFLVYIWQQGRWYYQSVAGLIPITPGDGRWVLHVPGGRVTPWQSGLWPSLGHAFIVKDHAKSYRSNFSAKLANPARVAHAPIGATEENRSGFLANLIAWGLNTAFDLPPGWEVSLLESNGRGWEVFGTEIDTSNFEIMIALAGQVVTVTGGTGFANASIHQTIRADLIKKTADALAYTLNTQAIPPWAWQHFGPEALAECPRVEWDIAPPADRKADADAITSVATAIGAIRPVLAVEGKALDTDALVNRFGIPIAEGAPTVDPSDEPAAAKPPSTGTPAKPDGDTKEPNG